MLPLSIGHNIWPKLIDYAALQEPGRYLAGIGLVAAGPQRHSVIVVPPSVVPTSALVPTYGLREIEFLVELVSPMRLVSLPTTVMTPFVSTVPELTNLVGVILQPPFKAELTSVSGAF